MFERLTEWVFVDLGVTDYRTAWELQKNVLETKRRDENFPDVVFVLEHFPVYTLGRRGGSSSLRVPETIISKAGIEIVPVERGGDITYHGPGQLVGYPMINLRKNNLKVIEYVEKLEETMIQTAARWKIRASRNIMNRGVWVGNRKLGSIGIAVKGGISFHGFALNVDVSLKPYDWINPCGLKNISVTSMSLECLSKIGVFDVRDVLAHCMADVFKIRRQHMPIGRLEDLMERC